MPKLRIDFGQAKQSAKKTELKRSASGKLLLDFTPYVYTRNRTHTYLWLRDNGYGAGVFLTMDSGSITVVSVDIFTEIIEPEVKADKKLKIAAKPAVTRRCYKVQDSRQTSWELEPRAYDFKQAVEKYHSSPIGRTAEAEREMRAILGLEPLAKGVSDEDLAGAKPERKRSPERAAKAPKQAGGYTLQELCAELKLDPTEARKTLRDKKVQKPGGRWEWASKEAAASVIAILGA